MDDPLFRLLESLNGHALQTLQELAEKVGVGTDLLAQMVGDLERSGYLKAVRPGCDAPCRNCSTASGCSPLREGRLWAVTERGLRALARR